MNSSSDEDCGSIWWNYSSNVSGSEVGTSMSPAPLLLPNADAPAPEPVLSIGLEGNFARLDSSILRPFPGVSPNTK